MFEWKKGTKKENIDYVLVMSTTGINSRDGSGVFHTNGIDDKYPRSLARTDSKTLPTAV